MDREPIEIPADRLPDRIADGRFDLPAHLGDRETGGHLEIEVDLQARQPRQADPRRGEAEAGEDGRPEAGGRKAGHAVRAEDGGPDDVDERLAGHENPVGRRVGHLTSRTTLPSPGEASE